MNCFIQKENKNRTLNKLKKKKIVEKRIRAKNRFELICAEKRSVESRAGRGGDGEWLLWRGTATESECGGERGSDGKRP